MARVLPIQTQFTAGELSPRLWARSDSDGYSAGLKRCFNMITRPQGPVSRRPGTRFLRNFGATYARVFPFQLPPQSVLGQAFPIVMTPGEIDVVGATGIAEGATINDNPSFSQGSTGWDIFGVGGDGSVGFDSINGQAVLTASTTDGVDTGIRQQISIDPAKQGDPHQLRIESDPAGVSIAPVIYFIVGSTAGGNEIVTETFASPNGTEITFTPNTTTVWVSVYIYGGNYSGEDPEPGVGPFPATKQRRVNLVEAREPGQPLAELVFTHDWDADDIQKAQYAMPPGRDEMYFVTPRKPPKVLSYNKGTGAWTFDDVDFVAKPDSWAGESWPSCITFFQGRSWWAGVEDRPETIWGSRPNQFRRLNLGPDPDNAIEATNAVRGKINWIMGARNLLFGSDVGEFAILASNELIIPADIRIEQQSANGGANIQPIRFGSSVVYVSADRRRIYDVAYSRDNESWISRELTFTAEHMFRDSRITGMDFARNPDSILWITQENGSFVAAVFDTVEQISGWSQHRMAGDYNLLSVGVIQVEGASETYCVALKQGGNELALCDMQRNKFMDMYVEEENTDSVDSSHFGNNQVDIKLDGSYYAPVSASSGVVSLPVDAGVAEVGFAFTSEIETLPLNMATRIGAGVITHKRHVKTVVRLISSALPLIDGEQPPDRTPAALMDESQPPWTKDLRITQLGYDRDATVRLTMEIPYPLEVSGIFGEVDQNLL